MPHSDAIPRLVDFVIEVPLGGHVKRGSTGAIEYLSPWPCPFNYGSAPAHAADDGDPADVVVLGPALARGARGTAHVVAVARFVDGGLADDKWVCVPAQPDGSQPGAPTAVDLQVVRRFFLRYQRIKAVAHALRRRTGATSFAGVDLLPPLPGTLAQKPPEPR